MYDNVEITELELVGWLLEVYVLATSKAGVGNYFRIVTMGKSTGQYFDKNYCFPYVDFLFYM